MYEVFFPIKILVLLLIKAFEHGFKLCKKHRVRRIAEHRSKIKIKIILYYLEFCRKNKKPRIEQG